jgi:hypothetical protein
MSPTEQRSCVPKFGPWVRKDYGSVAQVAFYDLENGSSILELKAPVSVTSLPSSAARYDLGRRLRPSEQGLDQRLHFWQSRFSASLLVNYG